MQDVFLLLARDAVSPRCAYIDYIFNTWSLFSLTSRLSWPLLPSLGHLASTTATSDRHMASRSLDRRRRRGGMQDVCFIACMTRDVCAFAAAYCKVRFHSSARPRERYLRHANRRKAAASVHALADSIDKLQLPPSPRKRLVFPRHDVGQTFDVSFNIV